MSPTIQVEQFDKCILLQFASLIFSKPLKRVRTAKHFEFDVINSIELNVNEGNKIIQLMNNLPFAEPARCHIPRFGMELLRNENQVFVCSICWRCNNIFITHKDTEQYINFDSQSKEASVLLDWFKFGFNTIVDVEDT